MIKSTATRYIQEKKLYSLSMTIEKLKKPFPACLAFGTCIERCSVKTIADDENGKAKVERAKCTGFGVCVIGCLTYAIELVPVSAEEWFQVPLQYGGMGREAPGVTGIEGVTCAPTVPAPT